MSCTFSPSSFAQICASAVRSPCPIAAAPVNTDTRPVFDTRTRPDSNGPRPVRVSNTGRVSVFTGAAAIGQGLRTALAQICANELGLKVQDITVVPGDTGGGGCENARE